MTSRFTSIGYVSGIVAAKSPRYPGVLFGYCVGRKENIGETAFWQPALMEATSSILSREGRTLDDSDSANTWLQAEAKFFLESPFDLQLLREGSDLPTEEEDLRSCFLKSFDLAGPLRLNFPLAAAFCWGGNLVPLCNQSALDEDGRKYFHAILEANDLPLNVPARHPIL